MSYSRRTQLQSATNAIRVLIVLCLFLACGLACTRISHQCCSEKREEDNLDNSRGNSINNRLTPLENLPRSAKLSSGSSAIAFSSRFQADQTPAEHFTWKLERYKSPNTAWSLYRYPGRGSSCKR